MAWESSLGGVAFACGGGFRDGDGCGSETVSLALSRGEPQSRMQPLTLHGCGRELLVEC